jgi:hypothetical protein
VYVARRSVTRDIEIVSPVPKLAYFATDQRVTALTASVLTSQFDDELQSCATTSRLQSDSYEIFKSFVPIRTEKIFDDNDCRALKLGPNFLNQRPT